MTMPDIVMSSNAFCIPWEYAATVGSILLSGIVALFLLLQKSRNDREDDQKNRIGKLERLLDDARRESDGDD